MNTAPILLTMAKAMEAIVATGQRPPVALFGPWAQGLRRLAAELDPAFVAADDAAQPPPPSAEIVDLRPILAAAPATIGQLLGPRGRLGDIVPLPVVRVERTVMPSSPETAKEPTHD